MLRCLFSGFGTSELLCSSAPVLSIRGRKRKFLIDLCPWLAFSQLRSYLKTEYLFITQLTAAYVNNGDDNDDSDGKRL